MNTKFCVESVKGVESMESDGTFIRLAHSIDAAAVESTFARRSTPYGCPDFKRIIETSLYSFVALSADNELVAFASFNDVPFVPGSVAERNVKDARSWAWQEALNLGFLADSLLWLEVCLAMDHKDEQRLLRNFCVGLFALSPSVKSILHLSPLEHDVLLGLLEPLSRSELMDLLLSSCTRR